MIMQVFRVLFFNIQHYFNYSSSFISACIYFRIHLLIFCWDQIRAVLNLWGSLEKTEVFSVRSLSIKTRCISVC